MIRRLNERSQAITRQITRKIEGFRASTGWSEWRASSRQPELDYEKCERIAEIFRSLVAASKTDQSLLADPKALKCFNHVEHFSQKINWSRDIVSGRGFPMGPAKLISPYLNNSDVILVWELNRLQSIPSLLLGDSIDLEYYGIAREILAHWISNNRFMMGINWQIPMEPAIRSVSLLPMVAFFQDQDAAAVIWQSYSYTVSEEMSIKRTGIKHNHILVSLASVLISGQVFKHKRSAPYLSLIAHELARQAEIQFNSDGGHFENSTGYHALCLEALLLVLLFCDLPPDISARIRSVCRIGLDFTRSYMSALGQSPNFGDSCDGRILHFDSYLEWNPLDHSYLLQLGQATDIDVRRVQKVSLFKESGYAFIHDGRIGIGFSSSSPHKQISGHNHCDKCSFVLSVDGKAMLIDPGTYMYNKRLDDRVLFRKTSAHNTVVLDGLEQANIDMSRTFSGMSNIDCEINVETDHEIVSVTMKHNGYRPTLGVSELLRKIIMRGNELLLYESYKGINRANTVSIIFSCHPDCEVLFKNDIFLRRQNSILVISPPKGFQVSINSTFFSGSYASRRRNKTIVMTSDNPSQTAEYSIRILEAGGHM